MADMSYPDGVDCVWLASDRHGHLAAFVTGGEGAIPVEVLASKVVAIEDLEERIGLLPRVSAARVLVQMKRPDDFVAMAERGLFVYDWTDVHRTRSESIHVYELVAVPEQPIKFETVPGQVVPLSACPMLDVAFADGASLDVRKQLDCRGGE